tara:strand:+ start:308 stop:478 length:171 start_codon:yes stop_codon:yes gene_type:complete
MANKKTPTKTSELKAAGMCFNRALKAEKQGDGAAEVDKWLNKAIVREDAAALLPDG